MERQASSPDQRDASGAPGAPARPEERLWETQKSRLSISRFGKILSSPCFGDFPCKSIN